MENQRLLIWATFGMLLWMTYQAWVTDQGPATAGQTQIELEAFGTTQINDLFSSLGAKALDADGDVYAIISSATEGAAFFAYASVVDNATNDPIFVPGR